MSTVAPEAPVSEFVVKRGKVFLKNNSLNIMRVWVKRFVENGDQVQVSLDKEYDDIVFTCPDWHTEMEVGLLCDIVNKFGFAKPIWREVD